MTAAYSEHFQHFLPLPWEPKNIYVKLILLLNVNRLKNNNFASFTKVQPLISPTIHSRTRKGRKEKQSERVREVLCVGSSPAVLCCMLNSSKFLKRPADLNLSIVCVCLCILTCYLIYVGINKTLWTIIHSTVSTTLDKNRTGSWLMDSKYKKYIVICTSATVDTACLYLDHCTVYMYIYIYTHM